MSTNDTQTDQSEDDAPPTDPNALWRCFCSHKCGPEGKLLPRRTFFNHQKKTRELEAADAARALLLMNAATSSISRPGHTSQNRDEAAGSSSDQGEDEMDLMEDSEDGEGQGGDFEQEGLPEAVDGMLDAMEFMGDEEAGGAMEDGQDWPNPAREDELELQDDDMPGAASPDLVLPPDVISDDDAIQTVPHLPSHSLARKILTKSTKSAD
ncbi:hypothetical protein C8F01DRAFT_1094911 [Mycena amicta]|nr:hypothetical protein C8F01DRAFT_1094911 [Mycena amicta]